MGVGVFMAVGLFGGVCVGVGVYVCVWVEVVTDKWTARHGTADVERARAMHFIDVPGCDPGFSQVTL